MEDFEEILNILLTIECDNCVPRNIRSRVGEAIKDLKENCEIEVAIRVDKVLQDLDDIAVDQNLPLYTRTQVWSVMSALESR